MGSQVLEEIGVKLTAPKVGVGCVVRREARILLIRRHRVHGDGTWSTPGGHLDPGEDPLECAVREVLEETGIEVESARFEGVTNDIFEAEGLHYVTLWVSADFASGEASALARYELTEVGWFSEEDLPDPLFPPLQRFLNGDVVGGPADTP